MSKVSGVRPAAHPVEATYPALGAHAVEVPAATEWVDALPLVRPLSLLCLDCFLKRATVMSMPAVVILARLLSYSLIPVLHELSASSPSSQMWANILDRLLPVQHQSQQRTQQPLHLFTRHRSLHAILHVLRSQMCQLGRERAREPRPEHDNRLRSSQKVSDGFITK